MSLFKSASVVSLLTLASRITGLVRELLMAATFGASALTDAFNVAFRIPNLLRRLFAEGAFSQAFVPVLAAAREQDGDDATRLMIGQIATVLAWALTATCVLGVAAAPILLLWIFLCWVAVLLGASLASGMAAFRYQPVALRLPLGYEIYGLLRMLGRFAQARAQGRGLHSDQILAMEPMLTDSLLQSLLRWLPGAAAGLRPGPPSYNRAHEREIRPRRGGSRHSPTDSPNPHTRHRRHWRRCRPRSALHRHLRLLRPRREGRRRYRQGKSSYP